MQESQTQTVTGTAAAFFDRYTLPKVALAVILAASLLGTWVSSALSGQASVALVVGKWVYLVALGILTGGFIWKHMFVRPADLGTGSQDYCTEMYERFDRIATWALVVLSTTGVVVVWQYLEVFGTTAHILGYGLILVTAVGLVGVTTRRDTPVGKQFRSLPGIAALTGTLAVVVATAVAEVAVRGLTPVDSVVRVLHLLAFTVWLGGAVWNIFVAVPSGEHRQTVPVVRAAGEQLERFRWAVRFVIPTLLLTGLFQALTALGTGLGSYIGGVIGLAVLVKVGFIGLLVVIFKLCPMWRACSPIAGICDLGELDRGSSEDGTSEVASDD